LSLQRLYALCGPVKVLFEEALKDIHEYVRRRSRQFAQTLVTQTLVTQTPVTQTKIPSKGLRSAGR
jgi:hypothetical protein